MLVKNKSLNFICLNLYNGKNLTEKNFWKAVSILEFHLKHTELTESLGLWVRVDLDLDIVHRALLYNTLCEELSYRSSPF